MVIKIICDCSDCLRHMLRKEEFIEKGVEISFLLLKKL